VNENSGEINSTVYDELRRLAAYYLSKDRATHTLEAAEATALAHEVYLRCFASGLIPFQDRAHFFAIASRLMRRILADHARRRGQ
jgi:hypothetical protein